MLSKIQLAQSKFQRMFTTFQPMFSKFQRESNAEQVPANVEQFPANVEQVPANVDQVLANIARPTIKLHHDNFQRKIVELVINIRDLIRGREYTGDLIISDEDKSLMCYVTKALKILRNKIWTFKTGSYKDNCAIIRLLKNQENKGCPENEVRKLSMRTN
ncbi:unnamed protein product [Allacma fusca]|uniref:Uncharacterized protein n=1 Tax=Allacma fusca TaxID=39272 RepID=A0A8J2L2A1_9HEXA|nr:unnamed protein product [Allacma fusca]